MLLVLARCGAASKKHLAELDEGIANARKARGSRIKHLPLRAGSFDKTRWTKYQ
jgi:hypothetical protein